ncbi:hypothetical protein CBW16_02560 [Flavobacteriaceae bacterium JJC]|nr:hypothetical protein CBW16_02560 [Flavobacteriaceae bacterium JJC]
MADFARIINGYWISEEIAPHRIGDGIEINLDISTDEGWSHATVKRNNEVVSFYALKYSKMIEHEDGRKLTLYFTVVNREELQQTIDEVVLECELIFESEPFQMKCKVNMEKFARIYTKIER